ncbi:hypothetical protein DID80_07975 [Candidatus Marinamargulisbacteria bacterium SCGC AAA071-K20]|nr:hypothetical protein DID80_07975 [Candidatus Marinamargulisbacteria bacterium SCGC AAA071-K20]
MTKRFDIPNLGFGLGLRPIHFQDFIDNKPKVDWLEIISENFMIDGGRSLHHLDYFIDHYPIIPHGVSLSIGSVDPLDFNYLKKLKALIDKIDPPWFSDHICWTKIHGKNLHNLMPLPYTTDTINYVSEKIKIVQDYMERPFIFENVSSYVEFSGSQMPEWDFVSHVSEKADCGILLDINNIFVSGFNHDFDPKTYINNVPKDRVLQFHIAGHKDKGTYILDSHDHEIRDEVWDLYSWAAPQFGEVSVLLERDDDIPPLPDLLDELIKAKQTYAITS